jgi:hypothetical protein
MVSIGKRAAGIGAAVAMIVSAGPVSLAAAAPAPVAPAGPFTAAYQAGSAAALGGWNAGADAAVGGWNAGATALGLPFQFTLNTSGPMGLHTAGVAPVTPSP